MTLSRWDWIPAYAIDGALFLAHAVLGAGALALMKIGLTDFRLSQWLASLVTRSGMLLIIGMMGYVASFGIWLVLIARHPISIAYPISIGLSLAAVAAVDLVWFARTPSATELGGLALILLGVTLLFTVSAGGNARAG